MGPKGALTTPKALGLSALSLCLALSFLALAAPAARSGRAAARCDRFAGPQGNDRAQGTRRHPFRTVGRLVQALGPGSVGCLLAGTFGGDLSIQRGGRPGKRMELRSASGIRATISGFIEIADTANYITISKLTIDGSSSPQNTLQVWGDMAKIVGNDINGGHSSSTQNCIFLGHPSYGTAYNVLIDHNRIHDCGAAGHGHGVYAAASADARIRRNKVYDNAGWGIQLYPDARSSQITENVIDGNGRGSIIFAGDGSHASSLNRVLYNILSNPVEGYNLNSYWEAPVGADNVAERNCLWPPGKDSSPSREGFVARRNLVGNPRFVNRAQRDFRLRAASPCTTKHLRRR
jgi:parallel beta-helix repeat protein